LKQISKQKTKFPSSSTPASVRILSNILDLPQGLHCNQREFCTIAIYQRSELRNL